jgi:hypothetical protein
MAGIFEAKIRVAAKSIVPGTSGEESYTENVAIPPANAYMIGYYGRVKTPFVGVTNPQVSLGVTGDVDRYMPKQPISVANDLISTSGGAIKPITGMKGFCAGMEKERIKSTATPIIATFTSSSTLFDPTAGEVEFVIVYVDTNAY